jgi:hypothetical protein
MCHDAFVNLKLHNEDLSIQSRVARGVVFAVVAFVIEAPPTGVKWQREQVFLSQQC